MKVLLTGASSFTGMWFARALAGAGHEVTAPLQRPREAYAGDTRAARVAELEPLVRLVPDCAFGSDAFLELTEEGFDLLAHHGAQVGDYRNPDFDVAGALAANTRNLRPMLQGGRLGALLLTSSIFAPGEGAGTAPLPAFSLYGLSKGLTNDLAAYLAQEAGLPFGRFVIPNPFGPFEEPRFCAYLMRCWKAGDVAGVRTPAYIRDNIHVDLLAAAYARYASEVALGQGAPVLSPSGYVSTQGEFAQRFAAEIGPRLGLDCALDLAHQTAFEEPLMRVNTEPATALVPGWDDAAAWDAVAAYYKDA